MASSSTRSCLYLLGRKSAEPERRLGQCFGGLNPKFLLRGFLYLVRGLIGFQDRLWKLTFAGFQGLLERVLRLRFWRFEAYLLPSFC